MVARENDPKGKGVMEVLSRTGPPIGALLWMAVMFLSWPVYAGAAVVSSVDRADVELNESFTLKVTVDTAIDTEPDVTSLEKDFFVLSRSELSNTMIVNGQISRTRTWSYVLMAKEAGDLKIPPVTVGSEQSEPLSISVAPERATLPGRSDVFITAEVDYDETWVQAQVLYRVKIYRAVATRQPRLYEPEISGVDTLVEIVGDERNYDALINGKNYNVVERVYALFPQASGQIAISAARFEARVLREGRITGRKVFRSEPVTVEVQPIPPAPATFPDAAWLPAKSVELSEEWSRKPDSLPAGEPITRHVTVTALGQLSTQLPVIEATESDGVKVYPDKPDLRVAAVAQGVLATRKDQYAMIGTKAGEVLVPALNLPWWNVDREDWEVATLPARTLTVLPSANVPDLPTADEVAALPVPPETVVVESTFWRRVSAALAVLWLMTLMLWWTRRRKSRVAKVTEPVAPPLYRQQSRIIREARRAARRDDIAAVKASLLDWGRLEWPEDSPRSIGDIASRVSDPLAGELRELARASYGPDGGQWNGERLDQALRSIRVLSPQNERCAADLPPLMPS